MYIYIYDYMIIYKYVYFGVSGKLSYASGDVYDGQWVEELGASPMKDMCTHIYIYIYICIERERYTHIHTYIHTYIYIYIYIYLFIYMYIY